MFFLLKKTNKNAEKKRIVILIRIFSAEKKTNKIQAFINSSTKQNCIKQFLVIQYN